MNNFQIILNITFIISAIAFIVSLYGDSLIASLLTGILFLGTGISLLVIWYDKVKSTRKKKRKIKR